MSQRTHQRYTPEFKEQALGLLNLGKPVADVARELQISSNLLYALRALRRLNARLQAENDILKKAAIILGSKPQPSSAS